MPGNHSVCAISRQSLRITAKATTISAKKATATGPLASVASPRKAKAATSQRRLRLSYQAYHASIAIVKLAVSGISVAAARANPMTATHDAVISAPSSSDPGRKRRRPNREGQAFPTMAGDPASV